MSTDHPWAMPEAPHGGSWRLTGRFWPTVRDDPADAEAISHKLSVRAGLVRQLASGLYTLTPIGLKVVQKVEAIIRDEMNRIGAQEILMPVMHPAEIWEATGRYGLSEQFRLEDRAGRKMVLGMTHEEIVTWHAAREIRSYRDLPQSWYQIQTKLRDEPRPKSGMLRVREFTMKDSYSFDADADGLERSYEAHSVAYANIFDRCGLTWYRVESDVGMMGGSGAHEYMAPSPSGEDVVARTASGSYAANVELAVSIAHDPDFGDTPAKPEEFATPGIGSIDELAEFTSLPAARLAKSVVLVSDDGPVLAIVRGEHQVHEKKIAHLIGAHRAAHPEEIREWFGADPGSLGPIGVRDDVRIIADATLATGHYVTGANRDGFHLRGVVLGRDFQAETADVRTVLEGEGSINGDGPVELVPVIEIGNIFKLGVKYSQALGASYLDEQGQEQTIIMGSYGIGPARAAMAAIEQGHDDDGIVWPVGIAPFDVHIVLIGDVDEPQGQYAVGLWAQLSDLGLDVLLDDRPGLRPGEKFAEADLLGCPIRITIGKRTLPDGPLEVQLRAGREKTEVAIDDAPNAIHALWQRLARG
jgi:prolyl-tRNA synthetase